MREIIFRGIRLDTKEFTYGYLWAKNNCSVGTRTLIMNSMGSAYEVDPETVGQFSGLRDNKRTAEFPEGQEIYEGDICSFMLAGVKRIECVHFGDGSFVLGSCISLHQSQLDYYREVRKSLLVIGNIHEHRNLLCGD